MMDICCSDFVIAGGSDCDDDDIELSYESASLIERSNPKPNMARNAHIVPGGLNGGKELVTVSSRRVAAKTEARAIADARMTAAEVGHFECLIVVEFSNFVD